MRHLALIACLAMTQTATPAAADACGDHFRSAMTAAVPVDRWLTETEDLLYTGLGWVTRNAVWDRLEERRASTNACQELQIIRNELNLIHRRIAEADRGFRLASALCWGVNRERAERNLLALGDSSTMATDIETYLISLEERCD